MKLITRYLAAGTILLSVNLVAQDFNESVEVTNDLIVDLSGSQRKTIVPNIPDSLGKFTYDFKYDVLIKPYKGAYEFTPYNVLYRPISNLPTSSVLFLNTGAGFGFAPVMQAVFTPRANGAMKWSFYQDFNGYLGDYSADSNAYYSGYEFNETLGFQGRAEFNSFTLLLNSFYNGIWSKNLTSEEMALHTFGIEAGLSSNYNLSLAFRTSSNDHSIETLRENTLVLKGCVSPYSGSGKNLSVPFETGFITSKGPNNEGAYYFKASPNMLYSSGDFSFTAGGALSLFTAERFFRIYPDFKIIWNIFGSNTMAYLGVDGSDHINSFYTFKSALPLFSRSNVKSDKYLRMSCEKYNAFAGLNGRIGHKFHYEIKGGVSEKGSAPLFALDDVNTTLAKITYTDYMLYFVNVSAEWKSRTLEANAKFTYNETDIYKRTSAFGLPRFTSQFGLTYNWIERLYAGLDLRYVSSRNSTEYNSLPQYFDLGVHFDAKLNSSVKLWMNASNLLCQHVEVIPYTAKRWPIITFGVCLIFR